MQIKCEATREHEANCATNIPSATRQCGRGDIIDKESVELRRNLVLRMRRFVFVDERQQAFYGFFRRDIALYTHFAAVEIHFPGT